MVTLCCMCKEYGQDTAYLPVHCRVEVQLWKLANLLVVYQQLGVCADCAGIIASWKLQKSAREDIG